MTPHSKHITVNFHSFRSKVQQVQLNQTNKVLSTIGRHVY